MSERLRYLLIPLLLSLTQCASILQRKEMKASAADPEEDAGALARIASKQGLTGEEAEQFQKDAQAATRARPPSCSGSTQVCSYNDVVQCSTASREQSPPDLPSLIALVKTAAAEGRRIRPLGARHTANTGICPDGGVTPHAVSLEHFQEYHVERERNTVRVGAGMLMGELMERLHGEGLSLGTAVPFFRGVTVGGALATAAHGSSWERSSVISSNVVALTLVDGRGLVHDLSEAQAAREPASRDLWLAARASMGAFGVVTEVTFKVVPTQNAHLSSGRARDGWLVDSANTADILQSRLGDDAFGQLLWFPNAQRYLWIRVAGDDPAEPTLAGKVLRREYENAMLTPHITPGGLRFAQRYLGATSKRPGNCWIEKIGLRRFARGVVREHEDRRSPRRWRRGQGPLHRMITSEVLPEQAQISQIDFEFAFPAERAGEILSLAEQVFDRQNRCLPLVGVFLRFSREPAVPTTLIGHSAVRSSSVTGDAARVMFFEFVVYAPARELARREHSPYFKPYDDFARELLKRGGWPHWAKNNATLLKAHGDNHEYRARLERFRKIADAHDPDGVFTSEFAEEVGLRTAAGTREASAEPQG